MSARDNPARPARICMLNYYAWGVFADLDGQDVHIGGEEVQHALLSRHLARQGYAVTSLVGDFGQNALVRIDGVDVRKTFALADGLPGLRFFSPRLASTWNALVQADADIYYTSCAGPMAAVMAHFCRRHARRFVFRVASDADCAPATLMLGHARDRLLYRYGLQRAHAVLAQTRTQAKLLREHYGVQARLAGMFSELPASVRPLDERDADLLWVANLRAMKRPEWFIDIARQVPRLRCHMAGAAHPGETALYRRVLDAAALLPNLQFHGQVRFGATSALFANARLFVNTSAFEGFPNTYLQAWAHGVPVIASFDPDGLIAAHGLGFVVDSADAAGARARALLSAPADWAACSARCRQYASARLAPETVAAPYLAAMVPS
ncbi:glycosyltransferase family 4 protein [Massilia sp. TWP1-3-3]|uniref:glycosyltransferase family 4 protein n=1 Tax=Massilia sp. TWP1-3-3 TaxID=2804573 RepID=UPI003CF04516